MSDDNAESFLGKVLSKFCDLRSLNVHVENELYFVKYH